MKYIIASKAKAQDYLVNLSCHRMNDTVVILNEREVNNNKYLAQFPTLDAKAEALDGSVLSIIELKQLINSGGISL